jgi:hypothetical protein
MGDVGYRSMHQGISHRFFFSIALDFAENEPIRYLSSEYNLLEFGKAKKLSMINMVLQGHRAVLPVRPKRPKTNGS